MKRFALLILASLVVVGLPATVAQARPAHAGTPAGAPAASPAQVPSGSGFVAVDPCRMFDTRTADTTGFCADFSAYPTTPVSGGTSFGYTVVTNSTGLADMPVDVTAIVLNVTAVDATAPTFVSVYPDASPRPTVSNLNVYGRNAIPNLVTVPVVRNGSGVGITDFYNDAGSVNLIADLAGYYVSGSGDGYTAIPVPCRVFDTRGTATPCANAPSVPIAPLGAGGSVTVPISGAAGVPSTATSVVLNVTAVNATAPTFVTAYPAGGAQPTASNLNLYSGNAQPNLVTVKLGANHAVTFYNYGGSVDLLADIAGYYEPGTGTHFTPLATPCRVFDSRSGLGNCSPDPNSDPNRAGQILGDQVAGLVIPGVDTIGVGATAVVLNTTVVGATAPTFLSVFPDDTTVYPPTSSNLNLYSANAVPNLVIVPVPPGDPNAPNAVSNGVVDFYNYAGSVDVIADVAGYFS